MASKKEPLRAETLESSEEESDAAETSEEESDSDQEPETANPSTEMSFEELLRLQNRVGKKAFNRSLQKSQERAQHLPHQQREPPGNTPQEMSSKIPVPFLRKVIPCKKTMHRDPRFDDLSGDYKPEVFEKTYSFLEDIKKRERQVLEKKLRKIRKPEQKKQIEQLLRRMDQQEAAAQKKRDQRARELDYKKELRENARQGHRPFYLKKGDKKKMALAEKYQELKKRGKLENFLSKKRKRNSHKDRRRLPNQ